MATLPVIIGVLIITSILLRQMPDEISLWKQPVTMLAIGIFIIASMVGLETWIDWK